VGIWLIDDGTAALDAPVCLAATNLETNLDRR
jgi:hypothetical protein